MKVRILTVALVLLALASALILKNSWNTWAELDRVQMALNVANGEVGYYRDAYGREHLRADAAVIDRRNADRFLRGIIDSQAKALHIKPKQIVQHTDIGVARSGYVQFTVDELDSIVMAAQRERNSHGAVKGDAVKFKNKYVYIPYADSIDLKINKYWKRNWFLGNKKWFVDVYSEDTAVKVYKYRNVAIADEYGPFAISLTGGVTVPNLRPVMVVGISYTPNFLRFKKRK